MSVAELTVKLEALSPEDYNMIVMLEYKDKKFVMRIYENLREEVVMRTALLLYPGIANGV